MTPLGGGGPTEAVVETVTVSGGPESVVGRDVTGVIAVVAGPPTGETTVVEAITEVGGPVAGPPTGDSKPWDSGVVLDCGSCASQAGVDMVSVEGQR